MPILIKRYQNRKLYNTQSKRYITLGGIEALIKNGQEINVIDNKSGEDITAVTLSQIIFELEKNQVGFLPIKLLLSLVQSGGKRIDEIRHSIFNSLSLYHHYDVEIERRVNRLVDEGELTQVTGSQLLEKLLAVGHKLHVFKGDLDERIFGYLLDSQIPTESDIQTLIHRVDTMSKRVDDSQLSEKDI